ncbi:MAG: DNA alkylation repair protein [Candidatus Undinarchaeales archaeon]|jgi:3-methyladenine DNA glycosylase AlkD|nr:DNA alkylation repair protein [Candidatus Undinarchaeales archaeon]
MEISTAKIEKIANLYNQPTRYCYELRKLGKNMVTEAERKQILTFIPTNLEFMGLKMDVLKKIAKKTTINCKDDVNECFTLLKTLWSDATREGRQIAAEVLALLSKKYPEQCFEFIQDRLHHIGDWELCDRLACMSMKQLIKNDYEKYKKLIPIWIQSENLWVRRFGTVCLVTISHLKHPDTTYILKSLDRVMDDSEYYVKKSVGWVLREVTKYYDPDIAYRFMRKYAKSDNKDTKWIVRDGSEKLDAKLREKILGILKSN